jgi:hypothetical protein
LKITLNPREYDFTKRRLCRPESLLCTERLRLRNGPSISLRAHFNPTKSARVQRVKIFENVTPTVRAFRRRFRYLIIRQAQIWLLKARYKSTPIATKSGAIHSLLLSERVSGISLDMCSLSARIGTYLKETAYWLRFRKGRLKANRLSRGSTQLITGSRRAMCAPFSAIAQFAFRTTAGGLYLKSVKAGFIFGAWLLAWTTLASAEDRRPDKSRLVT